MRIHTVKGNEKISDIAREYGIDEEILRMNNELEHGEATVGEELLILTPTRTYTVRRGDTAERLALRFGVRRRDIMAMNPWIEDEGLVTGRLLALKYDQKYYGMAAANGYFYNGCSIGELKKKLPYLTYITVGCMATEDGKLKRLFDGRDAVGIARSADKIPLLRVYDRNKDREKCKYSSELIDEIISYAIGGGYKGVTLAGRTLTEENLMDIRKRMIGCDLILITEISEKSPTYMSEYADGSVLVYSGANSNSEESSAYAKFATDGESAKTFIELPCFAECNGEYLTVNDALVRARRGACELKSHDSDGYLFFTDKKNQRYNMPSLKKIKATLATVHEYGYMGISFDIMRVPTPYLMMYNSCFGTSTYTSVRAREGCSRAREE